MMRKSKSVLKNFRIVAWILDSGRVIVNDVLVKGCKWERVDASLRRFTGLDGLTTYGFGFRNETQAAECSHIINQILSNVKGERAAYSVWIQYLFTLSHFDNVAQQSRA